VISLNLVLAGLRLGLKNCQVGEKWVSDDCSYLWYSIEARYHHVSNGGIKKPNEPLNSHKILFGFNIRYA
jgi:hypothetical protein